MAIMGFMDGSKYDSNTGKQVSAPTTTTKTSTSTKTSSGGSSSGGSTSPTTYSFMDGSTFDVNGNPLNKAAQDSITRIATTSGKTTQQVSSALAGNDRELLANISQALVGGGASMAPEVAPLQPPATLPNQPLVPPPSLPVKPPGQSVLDFTKQFQGAGQQTGQITPAQDYAFTSEQDFYGRTGLKDFKSVQTIKKGEVPTSKYYQYSDDNSAVVYERAGQPGVIPTPLVGTSEQERAQQRAAEIAKIKAELSGGQQAPPVYKSADEFVRLRKEQGIVKDEEELASIRNEANVLKESLRQYATTEGQGMPEGGRIGAVTEAERNVNFRLESLAIREQAVLSRVNTKNSYIDTAMKLGFQDYQTAYQAYNDSYNKNLQAIQLYNKQEDDRKQDAMTGFTTMVNLLSQSGLSALTPELSSQLDSLALQAGLPSGAFQYALQGIAKKEQIDNMKIVGNDIYMWTTSADGTPSLKLVQSLPPNESDSVLDLASKYPDAGISLTDSLATAQAKIQNSRIYKEQIRPPSSGGGGGSVTERLLSKQQSVIGSVKSLGRGTDGYANPNDYLDKATEYIGASGSVSDFLAAASPERYLTPANATWARDVLSGKNSSGIDPTVAAFLGLK